MNSLAVALAADSAATVSDGRDNKVYNSANKLFMLSKHHPVGVMVFSSSSLLGIPWETILKMFREELGSKEYDKLEEYGDKLIQYIDGNKYLFPKSVQDKFYLSAVEGLYVSIFKEVQRRLLEQMMSGGEEPDGKAIAKEIISSKLKDWQSKDNAKCFELLSIGKELATAFSGEIHKLAVTVFDGLSLDGDSATALRELAILLVSKDEIPTESLSGIVVAGFGRMEYFPVMQVFDVGEIFLDRLKYRRKPVEKIDTENQSIVKPFAQSEMVDTFLRGVNPSFEVRMIEEFVNLVVGFPDEVIDAITDLTDEQRNQWKDKIRPQSKEPILKFVKELETHRLERHRGPILQAIINLPIEELAHVAASLVNLNSFQKRMSLGPETVGGPVDVAVISKGDGFIWIARKHYFRSNLNHHFFRNYERRMRPEEAETLEEEKDGQ
jgi:hypothetical protein